jgi:hypothetical protein
MSQDLNQRTIDTSEERLEAPTSLLENVETTAAFALGVRSLRHRSTALEICARADAPAGAVGAIFEAIALNWRACRVARGDSSSRENWRWRAPQLQIAAHNASPEVVLERAIVGACERAGRRDWANQVPVASGVAGASAERRRAIDLVHQTGPNAFEFIELKVASDNPLYAAVEIIGYTAIWLLSRGDSAPNPSSLLNAEAVAAVVLAPESYYARYRLEGIARRLDEEMATLGRRFGLGLSFRFEAFPDEFAAPPHSDQRIATLLASRRRL